MQPSIPVISTHWIKNCFRVYAHTVNHWIWMRWHECIARLSLPRQFKQGGAMSCNSIKREQNGCVIKLYYNEREVLIFSYFLRNRLLILKSSEFILFLVQEQGKYMCLSFSGFLEARLSKRRNNVDKIPESLYFVMLLYYSYWNLRCRGCSLTFHHYSEYFSWFDLEI